MSQIQEKLIKAGVRNLKEFGFPGCNTETIITDPVYSAFFSRMLGENKDQGFDADIDVLIGKIEAAHPPLTSPTK